MGAFFVKIANWSLMVLAVCYLLERIRFMKPLLTIIAVMLLEEHVGG